MITFTLSNQSYIMRHVYRTFAYDHRESHVFSREISVRNFWQSCYSNQAETVIIEEKKRGILQNDDPTSITIHSAFLRTQEETSAISKMAKFANVLPVRPRQFRVCLESRNSCFEPVDSLNAIDLGSTVVRYTSFWKFRIKTIVSPECFFTGSDYYATRSNRVKDVYLCHCIATK